jgi:hypothetical protein
MTEQERINQIVDMLDAFAERGGGHINLTVEDVDGQEQVANALSVDCNNSQSACSVPTLHKDIDDENDEL